MLFLIHSDESSEINSKYIPIYELKESYNESHRHANHFTFRRKQKKPINIL